MQPAAVFGIWASPRHRLDPRRARPARRAAALGLLAALFVCGLLLPAVAAAIAGGPPPGYARIWVYREYEPSVSLDRPYVRFNGRIVGIAELDGAFYRDVAPGEYHVTVDTVGRDVNQFVRVAAAAGQQIYIEVQVLQYWACEGYQMQTPWCPPTFYTRLQSPQVGAAAIARSKIYGGG
jgi:hypothetical protein